MVKIRLKRVGRPGVHLYRLGVIESARSNQTPFLEILAAYNPSAKDGEKFQGLKKDRLQYWASVGAQMTPATARILKKENALPEAAASKK